jgi:hypothetical protein
MASSAWDIRLRGLLGAALREVTEENLSGLIENSVCEDADLDFKQESYGGGDRAKRELAGDVAAMANERGGLIIIGIRDDEDVAAELTPVERADGEEARFRLIVAANAAPNIDFEIYVVRSAQDEKKGYILLAIPPSVLRPHAVRKNNDLRYPRRNGTTTRWLSESEVADMYRDRFRLATDQTGRAETILREGSERLQLDEDSAHLTVALAPTSFGAMEISQERLREIEEWATESTGTYFWRGFFGSRPRARPGLRRVVMAYSFGDREEPRLPYAELYRDGSGFTCEKVSHPSHFGNQPERPQRVLVPNANLIWEVARALRLLGRHAVENSGAWGEAVVVARLGGKSMVLTYLMDGRFEQQYTEKGFDGPIDSRHTLLLESIAGEDQDLLASSRLVVGDLVNALGSSEINQIDPEGRIRTQYVRTDAQFIQFAEDCGVELSGD